MLNLFRNFIKILRDPVGPLFFKGAFTQQLQTPVGFVVFRTPFSAVVFFQSRSISTVDWLRNRFPAGRKISEVRAIISVVQALLQIRETRCQLHPPGQKSFICFRRSRHRPCSSFRSSGRGRSSEIPVCRPVLQQMTRRIYSPRPSERSRRSATKIKSGWFC